MYIICAQADRHCQRSSVVTDSESADFSGVRLNLNLQIFFAAVSDGFGSSVH